MLLLQKTLAACLSKFSFSKSLSFKMTFFRKAFQIKPELRKPFDTLSRAESKSLQPGIRLTDTTEFKKPVPKGRFSVPSNFIQHRLSQVKRLS